MKIIDLFVKISKGEEVPNEIKYQDVIFEFDEDTVQYYEKGGYHDTDSSLRHWLSDFNDLNDEVESMDTIEKLPYYSLEKIQKSKNKAEWYKNRINLLEKQANDYHNKINELIDKVNKLKGEK